MTEILQNRSIEVKHTRLRRATNAVVVPVGAIAYRNPFVLRDDRFPIGGYANAATRRRDDERDPMNIRRNITLVKAGAGVYEDRDFLLSR
jgi:hypothetical protein